MRFLGRALGADLVAVRPVGGGSICSAYRAELAGGGAAFVRTPASAVRGATGETSARRG